MTGPSWWILQGRRFGVNGVVGLVGFVIFSMVARSLWYAVSIRRARWKRISRKLRVRWIFDVMIVCRRIRSPVALFEHLHSHVRKRNHSLSLIAHGLHDKFSPSVNFVTAGQSCDHSSVNPPSQNALLGPSPNWKSGRANLKPFKIQRSIRAYNGHSYCHHRCM